VSPVRQLFIEALARRAAAQTGEARRLLDARLAALRAESSGVELPAAPPAARPQGALGALARELARDHEPAGSIAQPELHTLRRFRSTWTRLSAENRLHQALAQVPLQAGPLNSHHLVHRALVLMQGTSPEYLQRFVPYVDALLALDQMQAPPPPTPVRSRRAAASRAARKSRS